MRWFPIASVLWVIVVALATCCCGCEGSATAATFQPPASVPDGPIPPPAGAFTGEGLTLTLANDGSEYTGTAKLRDGEFKLRGKFDPVKGLSGTFDAGGKTYAWTASVDGRTLKFQTGGTEYKLPIPSPDSNDNPLAKKPASSADNPLAKKPDASKTTSQPAADTLRFTRHSIKDPGINNIEAISFLLPEGWRPEGGVVWLPDYSILANLRMTITDPQTGAQIQTLPVQNFSWIENPVMPMQPGSNYMGNIVYQAVRDVPEFIRLFYTSPQSVGHALPHLAQGSARQVSIEELPKVHEQQISQAYGGQSQVVAAKVRYEYDRAGKPWEEDVYIALVYTTQQGMTIWSVNTAYAFRAPRGELDKLAPRMAASVNSARLSPDWFGGYMHVQQLFANRMNQGIKNAAAISETITRNSEEIRRMYSDSYKRQCESQDRISRGFSEHIRGVETYRNPFEDRPIELPAGYQDVWVNAQGQYVLSPQSGYDPNVGSTVEWRRMEHAK